MKLILTSTGFANKNIEKLFLSLLNKPINKVKVLFVPTAAVDNESKEILPLCIEDLTNIGILEKNIIEFDFKYFSMNKMTDRERRFYIKQSFDFKHVKDEIKRLNKIDFYDFDAIYVAGGDECILIREINESDRKDELIDAINNHLIYIGISAGSMIVSDYIEEHKHFRHNSSVNIQGLGLIHPTIDVHVERDATPAGKTNLDNIRLSDNSCLFINGNKMEVIE